jgi:streptogramin lyase
MLEQAVYAGRDHTSILAAVLLGLALLAAPARANDVARVPLGSTLGEVVAAPDGGAWVQVIRPSGNAIGRAEADNSFRTTAVDDAFTESATLGPDGQVWFAVAGRELLRADAAGNVTRIGPLDWGSADGIATGPDGTLWAAATSEQTLAHVTPDGRVSMTPFALPACRPLVQLAEMVRAADGAMWVADVGCGRLIRIVPGGAPVTFSLGAEESPARLAADAAGGVFFAEITDPIVGHADAAGRITRVTVPGQRNPTDVAVAPDGTAWFALGRCALGRLSPGAGALALVPAPIPARRLAFDPAGGLWLASATRLVHTTTAALGGSCDDTAPRLRLRPRLGRRISLAALRRGIRIEVGERAAVDALAFYRERSGGDTRVGHNLLRVGRSAVYRVPRAQLRRFQRALRAGRRPELTFFATAADSDGNVASAQGSPRITR